MYPRQSFGPAHPPKIDIFEVFIISEENFVSDMEYKA